jgi:hypothetical protein
MTPTLLGRIQTRVFVTVAVGGPWTVLLGVVLPGLRVRDGLLVLITMGIVGIAWELGYHWLMGFRWEKDWPSLLGLLTGINEAIVLGLILRIGLVPGLSAGPSMVTYLVHFITVWLLIWAWLQGPMKVFDPRWRFRGGRLL